MQKYDVDQSFIRVVLAFGEDPNVTESSNSFFSIQERNGITQGTSEAFSPLLPLTLLSVSYLINYVEENHRQREEGTNEWSWRHTGVFHRHSVSSDLFIILHPRLGDSLGKRLMEILSSSPDKLTSSAFDLHCVVLSTFVDNWRWFFRALGDQFKYEV
jgi:hypothetical protein